MHLPLLLSSELSSHRPLRTALLTELHPQIDSQLDLKLDSRLLRPLDLASLSKLLDALLVPLDPSRFRSLHVSAHRSLLLQIDAAMLPETQPGRRPLYVNSRACNCVQPVHSCMVMSHSRLVLVVQFFSAIPRDRVSVVSVRNRPDRAQRWLPGLPRPAHVREALGQPC
jgi:hypothetical protein